jgi:HAD superfamily hydrolase (TIGR01450 family)
MRYSVFTSLRRYIEAHSGPDYQGFLIDIDGTLKLGNQAIPAANEALSYLREKGYPYLLATNDAGCSLRAKAASLRCMGLAIEDDDIFCCAESLKQCVERLGLTGCRFFVLGRLGEPCYGAEAGLVVERDPDMAHTCGGVIVSELGYNWEPAINAAVNLLIRKPQSICIAPNPDSYWRAHSGDGINIGAGAIVDLILRIAKKNGMRTRPIYLGKPNRVFFQNALFKLKAHCGKNIQKNAVLVVGDSIHSDIRGANGSGMPSALVLTGVTSMNALESVKNRQLIPKVVLEHI